MPITLERYVFFARNISWFVRHDAEKKNILIFLAKKRWISNENSRISNVNIKWKKGGACAPCGVIPLILDNSPLIHCEFLPFFSGFGTKAKEKTTWGDTSAAPFSFYI